MKPPGPLLLVAQRLGPLRDRVVFVGGMIRGLLSTDPAAAPARPTDDVDLIVDVPTLAEYHLLGATLRANGFHEDTSNGAPLCRWRVEGVSADIMPFDARLAPERTSVDGEWATGSAGWSSSRHRACVLVWLRWTSHVPSES